MAHPIGETARQARRRRTGSWIVPVLIPIGVVISLWFTLVTVHRADKRDAQRAAAAALAVADGQRVSSCRSRNSAQESARRDRDALLNGLGEGPGVDQFKARVLPTLSTYVNVDTDCDKDGFFDRNDYETVAPTPIESGQRVPVPEGRG